MIWLEFIVFWVFWVGICYMIYRAFDPDALVGYSKYVYNLENGNQDSKDNQE